MSSEHRCKEDEEDPLVIDEDAAEKEFEPSVEMMVNDFDDERTLEEEEALENPEGGEEEELDALNQEQGIPIEDLLKMYGYQKESNGDDPSTSAASATTATTMTKVPKEEETYAGAEPEGEDNNNLDGIKEKSIVPDSHFDEDEYMQSPKKRPSNSSSPSPKKSKSSELSRFYESTLEGRSLRSTTSNPGGSVEDEDSDNGGSGHEGGTAASLAEPEERDFSWKKTIMIGPSFQASVPSGLCKYGDSLPYENDDKQLWDPKLLSPDEVEDYLAKSYEASHSSGNGVGSLPLGAHIRDDEQALFLLFQCGYNYEEALRRRRMNAISPADTMSLWSEEECRAFELGLRLYGKDFTMIQQQKVRTRSVGEIVQFYYLWKKTERHDVFANTNRLEKKKYTLHPGTTDYMDRFIDEQDSSRDRSSSPNYHSMLYGSSSGVSLAAGEGIGVGNPGTFSSNVNPSASPGSHSISSAVVNNSSNNSLTTTTANAITTTTGSVKSSSNGGSSSSFQSSLQGP